jgi:predicted RNase H-like HicB family nuclease
MRSFTVVLTPEPDGSAYNVTVPALPGCLTWGATVEDALVMARDAIAVYLEGEEDEYDTKGGDILIATVAVPRAATARLAS